MVFSGGLFREGTVTADHSQTVTTVLSIDVLREQLYLITLDAFYSNIELYIDDDLSSLVSF